MVVLADEVAAEAWDSAAAALATKPASPAPTLVVMAGVPLAGKSTLARALAEHARTRTLHVENDALRVRIAARQRLAEPRHDAEEHFLTYRAGWALARRALREGCNAIHDATNLTESGRRGAYAVADAERARTAVVIVRTSEEALGGRVALVGASRQAAHAKLGPRPPKPEASRPYLVVDGAEPLDALLARVRAWAELAPLF
jgi:predicted kinase